MDSPVAVARAIVTVATVTPPWTNAATSGGQVNKLKVPKQWYYLTHTTTLG